MLAGIRSRLTYANVTATIALFVALGGTAWAAATINGSDVVNNSLKSVDLKDDKGVKGADVVPDSLSGDEIHEDGLGSVPSAVNAESAANAEALDGKDSSSFQALGSDGWTALSLHAVAGGCHWADFGLGFTTAGFFRDQDGIVHLRGLVRAVPTDQLCPSSWLTLIGTLPAGYRPEASGVFTISANNKPGRVDVLANGQIVPDGSYPGLDDVRNWLSLEGISFRCAPSGQDGCP